MLTEPQILQFIREHTAISVPEVLGMSRDLLEYPRCLYERVPRQTFPGRPVIESPDLLARICEVAGRHLADLHSTDTFEHCGPLTIGNDGVTAANVADDRPSGFQQTLEAQTDQFGPRFEPYFETLYEHTSEAATKCRSTTHVTPVLAQWTIVPRTS